MSSDVVEESRKIAPVVDHRGRDMSREIVSPLNGAVMHPPAKGYTSNPKGRPTGGASVLEWCNVLIDQEATEPELRKLAKDKEAAPRKRIAAEIILDCLSGDYDKAGRLLRGEAIDRLLDRLVGKPKQTVESSHTEDVTVTEVKVELAACLSHFEQHCKPVARGEATALPEPEKPSEG